MTKSFRIYHTPGSFGNYLGYLIDSHTKGELLPSPFYASGNSHNREPITQSLDIVLTEPYENFLNLKKDSQHIGIYWPEQYFFYILHSAYGRTNAGQYGECGVLRMQENLWEYIKQHQGHNIKGNDWSHFLQDLTSLFKFECNQHNQTVPRNILRQLFFFYLANAHNNKLTIRNNEIKKNKNLHLISIEQIIDYQTLSLFLKDLSGKTLDFHDIHNKFTELNRSLKAYKIKEDVFNSVKNKINKNIVDTDVITEAGILFDLEKYFYDIPFYSTSEFFKNTKSMIEYAQYFPNYMKSPNPLFAKQLHNIIKKVDNNEWFKK